MLKGIRIPLNTTSRDKNPERTTAQKLEEIDGKPIRISRMRDLGIVRFSLPYVDGLSVEFLEESESEQRISINHFNIGDEELCKHGIGSRLLNRAIRYGLEKNNNMTGLVHSSANLALLNTVVGVVGEEHVSVRNRGEGYGEGQPKPLSDMFDDVPYERGMPYLMDRIDASIDPDRFLD